MNKGCRAGPWPATGYPVFGIRRMQNATAPTAGKMALAGIAALADIAPVVPVTGTMLDTLWLFTFKTWLLSCSFLASGGPY